MNCLDDFEKHAEEILSYKAFGYYTRGGEVTYSDNFTAFRRWRLLPRMLCDVPHRDISTTILGHKISFPVCVAPTAMHRMAHPDGEMATAKGAAAMDTGFTLSVLSNCNLEEVAEASPNGLLFFQINTFWQKDLLTHLVRRAEKSGYKAFVLTVDSPFHKRRFSKDDMCPEMGNFEAFQSTNDDLKGRSWQEFASDLPDPAMVLQDVKWLMSITSLPIILKGILTVEDALKAVELGVAGILVSNHGSRTLDTTPATIDVLEPIVHAVSGRCEVYLDGGVRHGTDVLKALALGAKAVFIGRPALFGLAYDGEEGVAKVLQILKEEFEVAMALTGCANAASIQRSLVVHQSLYPERFT